MGTRIIAVDVTFPYSSGAVAVGVIIALLDGLLGGLFGVAAEETAGVYPEALFVFQGKGEEVPFENVGFYKVDDYTVRIVLENRTSYNYFMYSIAGAAGMFMLANFLLNTTI